MISTDLRRGFGERRESRHSPVGGIGPSLWTDCQMQQVKGNLQNNCLFMQLDKEAYRKLSLMHGPHRYQHEGTLVGMLKNRGMTAGKPTDTRVSSSGLEPISPEVFEVLIYRGNALRRTSPIAAIFSTERLRKTHWIFQGGVKQQALWEGTS